MFVRIFCGVVFCINCISGLQAQSPNAASTDKKTPTLAPQQENDSSVLPKPETTSSPDADAFSPLTAQEHPWGRFRPKSWICMQTVIWTVQDNERIASVRETKTTLESIEKDGVTLKKVATLNIGGKRIETAPLVERFDFYREPMENDVVGKNAGSGKLLVNNLVIPCKKRVYEYKGTTEKRITTLWYTTQLYPYVLRVESILTALPSETVPEERILRRSVTEVFESSSFHLRRSKEGAYRYRTRTTDGHMTTVVEATCSRLVPGGIIHETTREFDASGAEIRTTETRLINYFCMAPTPDGALEEPPYLGPVPVRPRWRRFYALPPTYFEPQQQ